MNPPFPTPAPSTTTPTVVRDVLRRLRRQIRSYVVYEGAATLVICLGIAFWLGLGMDYLPVLAGASEMPREARQVFLIVAAVVSAVILYQVVIRRLFHPLHDASLALLIERRFPLFHDSLVTTIELAGSEKQPPLTDPLLGGDEVGPVPSQSMLQQTVQQAVARLPKIQLHKVFRFGPLVAKSLGALTALASIVGLGLISEHALATALARLVWLSDDPWPRHAHIELVDFVEGERKVAKGTDLVVRVRADANRRVAPPQLCTILYETHDGDQGRVNMSRDGEPRDGFQYYVFNGKPFNGILNDIDFDVIGYDHRLRNQRVKVVLSPVVTQVRLQCEPPKYTQLLPREELWTPGTQLPYGTNIQAQIHTNKELVRVTLRNIDTGEEQVRDLDTPTRQLLHDVGTLTGRQAVALTLLDTDGIESLEPFLLTIGAVEDSIPQVDVTLRGIGNSVTPQARLAIEGQISDDYEVTRQWFDLRIDDTHREFDLPLSAGESISAALDLREEANADRPQPLQLQPQDRLIFSVKANDRFDLDGETHTGTSDAVSLTVVRPDELLAILDGRELGLRRRFEQIRVETIQSRDSLARLRASFRDDTTPAQPDAAQQNLSELRERWGGWAQQKTAQTVLEVRGIALAFEDIREELINNRVDTPERKVRLEQQIIRPLKDISEELLPALQQQVDSLLQALRPNALTAEAEVEAVEAVVRADKVVVAMDAVLEKMLELEDYAELVNVIRQILEDQDQLMKRTKEERDRGVLDFLK